METEQTEQSDWLEASKMIYIIITMTFIIFTLFFIADDIEKIADFTEHKHKVECPLEDDYIKGEFVLPLDTVNKAE